MPLADGGTVLFLYVNYDMDLGNQMGGSHCFT